MSEPLKTAEQLELEIADARSGRDGMPQTMGQLVDHIIALYGEEFEKANIEIAKLRRLNFDATRGWSVCATALHAREREWFTSADKDGDCAIFDKFRQLIGVGATPVQTLALVTEHNGRRGGGPSGEALARVFHEIYERRAPEFGYETRKETRAFDPTTPNGRLMIAVCNELLQ